MKTCLSINAAPTQRRKLVERYPDAFSDADAWRHLHVPPGWLALLRLALEDAAVEPGKRVSITRLWVEEGVLRAAFSAGSVQARGEFRALLSQTREYCPCCGTVWSDADCGATLEE